MCEATSIAIASFALTAGGTIASHVSEAKAAAKAREAAEKDHAIKTHDIGKRQVEELLATQREITAGQRQAREASGMARLSAAEAGVSGMSVDALLGDIARDESSYTQSVQQNSVITIEQLQRMKGGADAELYSRRNAAQGPSTAATAVQVGGSALDTWGRMRLQREP